MTAGELLEELRRRGATVTTEGGELHIVAPKGALTPELRQALAGHKPELLVLLAGELERVYWTTGPRPDLVEDSSLWARLLSLAYSIDGGDPYGMFQALHCLRCEGARLQVAQDTAVLDPGEWAPEEYVDVWGQYLAPHSGELTRLLCELATVATSKAA